MPTLLAQPSALISEPPDIRVTGLNAGERVQLCAEALDNNGELWRSAAVFEVPASGILDLATAAPASGSYAGADAAGLLWSLRPRDDLSPAFFEPPDAGFDVALTLEVDGRVADAATLRRLTRAPDLTRLDVRDAGLHGTFFIPPDSLRGVVLELGGSEGGLHETRAALLASHGFVVLALGYFDLPGLPPQLINLPLEYFQTALAWLRARPEVAGRRIGVLGASKGGELALLLGATFPDDIGAVVGVVPSGLVFEGIDRARRHPAGQPMSSWSLGGQALPYIPYTVNDWGAYFSAPPPVALTPAHVDAVAAADPATLAAATVPVERVRGPVLLVSGGDDQTWPSAELSRVAQRRIETHGGEVEHLTNPNAGHYLSIPGLPTLVRTPWGNGGGTPQANAHLQQRAWARTLAVLARA